MPATTHAVLALSPEHFLGFRAAFFLFLIYLLAHFSLLALGDAGFWDDGPFFEGNAGVTFLCFFWIVIGRFNYFPRAREQREPASLIRMDGSYRQGKLAKGLERADASR